MAMDLSASNTRKPKIFGTGNSEMAESLTLRQDKPAWEHPKKRVGQKILRLLGSMLKASSIHLQSIYSQEPLEI